MIGVITNFLVKDTTSVNWPNLHTFLIEYSPENLPMGYTAELFFEIRDYIKSMAYPIDNIIHQKNWVKDEVGNVITCRIFESLDFLNYFREWTVDSEYQKLALLEKMNLDIVVKDISDETILNEIISIKNPTYDNYVTYLQ